MDIEPVPTCKVLRCNPIAATSAGIITAETAAAITSGAVTPSTFLPVLNSAGVNTAAKLGGVAGEATVVKGVAGASGGDAILDGASGLMNAPKSVVYIPPGSVVLQPKGSPLCGPATCNMVINDAKGNVVDLNQVVSQFQGVRTSGVNINEMNAVLSQNGVASKATTTLSVDQLNIALANGQPVIVGVPAGTGNHFIIVDSMTTVNNVLYYMTRDPFVGPRGVRSDILVNAIHANGNAIIVGK